MACAFLTTSVMFLKLWAAMGLLMFSECNESRWQSPSRAAVKNCLLDILNWVASWNKLKQGASILLLKKTITYLFYPLIICMYLFMCMGISMREQVSREARGGRRSPAATITSSCEPTEVGAGNQTWVIWRAAFALKHWTIFPASFNLLGSIFQCVKRFSTNSTVVVWMRMAT